MEAEGQASSLPSRPEVGHPGSSCHWDALPSGSAPVGRGMAPMSTVSTSSGRSRPSGRGLDSFLVRRDLGFPFDGRGLYVPFQSGRRAPGRAGGQRGEVLCPRRPVFVLGSSVKATGLSPAGSAQLLQGVPGPVSRGSPEAQGLAQLHSPSALGPRESQSLPLLGLSFLDCESGRLD